MDRIQKAEELFRGGCNCSQAVFAAFADEFGLDEELAKRLATGLGGGVGRMREVCGAVSAAALVIGMRLGPDKMKAYPVIQDFCAKFKEKCGSIICRDLLVREAAGDGLENFDLTRREVRERRIVLQQVFDVRRQVAFALGDFQDRTDQLVVA